LLVGIEQLGKWRTIGRRVPVTEEIVVGTAVFPIEQGLFLGRGKCAVEIIQMQRSDVLAAPQHSVAKFSAQGACQEFGGGQLTPYQTAETAWRHAVIRQQPPVA